MTEYTKKSLWLSLKNIWKNYPVPPKVLINALTITLFHDRFPTCFLLLFFVVVVVVYFSDEASKRNSFVFLLIKECDLKY